MTTIPLILKAEPVYRLDPAARRGRQPNVAVVYATADGTVDVLEGGRPMRFTDQLAGRYRYRYEVDMSDHDRTVELRSSPPPAKGGVHYFVARVDVGFRVTDPAQVVRRNIRDAFRVVCDHLMFTLRNITVDFPIDAARQAEDAVNAEAGHRATIEDCIELYRCRARLAPDPDAANYLRDEQHAHARNAVRGAEHVLEAAEADRTNHVELIRQLGSLEQRRREREALGGRPFDLQDLLALHIERHPEDTEQALKMAAEILDRDREHSDTADQRRWKALESMADRNLLQAIDVDPIRNRLVAGLSQQPAPLPSRAAVDGWDDPLPTGGSDPDPGPDDEPAPLPGLIPVYLVVDESSAVASGIAALNAGLRELYGAVAGQPEIARVVRLALVSYADDADVRLALQEVRPDTPLPAFTARPGPVRLVTAFERLAECVPHDTETLKRRTPSPRRPQVLLLRGGPPDDDGSWVAAHHALVDRHRQRYAPDIIACGVGDADPYTIRDIATAAELAFVAPDRDIGAAIHSFCAFAHRRIVEYGRAVLDGDQHAVITGPDGFRPATELIASSMRGN